jgi:hypothetical protein
MTASLLIGLVYDARPGPIFFAIAGSALVAALFVAGGLWVVRISREQPATFSRKLFWISLAGMGLFGAIPFGLMGIDSPPFLGLALALFAIGLYALILGFLPSKDTRHENPKPHPQPPTVVSDTLPGDSRVQQP